MQYNNISDYEKLLADGVTEVQCGDNTFYVKVAGPLNFDIMAAMTDKKISKEDQEKRGKLLACCRTYLSNAAIALKHLENGTGGSGGGGGGGTSYTSIEKAIAAMVAATETLDKGETDMEIKIKKKIVKLQDDIVAAYAPCKEAFKKVTGEKRLFKPTISIKKS